MNKIIKSSLLLFTMLIAFAMSGCDSLENFLFDLPISFTVTASDNTSAAQGQSYCLDQNETYNDYVDKLNSITLVEAHIVTQSISSGDESIQGDGNLRLFAGTNDSGTLLLEYEDSNVKLGDHFSPNGYKLNLTQAHIDAVNASLANGNTCFYADYQVSNVQGTNGTFTIELKIDVLFQLDASL